MSVKQGNGNPGDVLTKVYGYGDDNVVITELSGRFEEEVGCFERVVQIGFEDGTVVNVSYPKEDGRYGGVWGIEYVAKGTAKQTLDLCEDDEANPYSDVLKIYSKAKSYIVISKEKAKQGKTGMVEGWLAKINSRVCDLKASGCTPIAIILPTYLAGAFSESAGIQEGHAIDVFGIPVWYGDTPSIVVKV